MKSGKNLPTELDKAYKIKLNPQKKEGKVKTKSVSALSIFSFPFLLCAIAVIDK